MNVLYIMPLVEGFKDMLKGDVESKGLPSLILPLKKIIETNNNVDIIIISDFSDEISIKVDWLKKENIVANINNDLVKSKGIQKGMRLIKSSVKEFVTVFHLLKSKSYDVVFCHGTAAVIGNVVANLLHVPCVYRLYGTVGLYHEIEENGSLLTAIKNPLYFLIFKLKKFCIIGTDEGSHTDKVYEKWKPNKNPYPFYYWINGVDIQEISELQEDSYNIPVKPYLFMAGRVTGVKNQSYAIKMLNELKNRSISIDLYFAGHIEEGYFSILKEMIDEYGLGDRIHFLGPIPREHLKLMGYYAKACIICDDFCQNGNVFYELYSTGSIIVSVDDGSLDRFAENGKSIFLANNISSAADALQNILNLSETERQGIRQLAIKKSTETMPTWDERIEKEIEILERACENAGK